MPAAAGAQGQLMPRVRKLMVEHIDEAEQHVLKLAAVRQRFVSDFDVRRRVVPRPAASRRQAEEAMTLDRRRMMTALGDVTLGGPVRSPVRSPPPSSSTRLAPEAKRGLVACSTCMR